MAACGIPPLERHYQLSNTATQLETEIIQEVVAEFVAATGLDLVVELSDQELKVMQSETPVIEIADNCNDNPSCGPEVTGYYRRHTGSIYLTNLRQYELSPCAPRDQVPRFKLVVFHELGHAFGLGHTLNQAEIMGPKSTCDSHPNYDNLQRFYSQICEINRCK